MSFSQFLVLMALIEHSELKQSEIADFVGVTPAVITKQVEELSGQGLVQLGPSHSDRRANVVRLSSKGREIAHKALKVVEDSFHDQAKFPDHYKSKLSQWLDIQDN